VARGRAKPSAPAESVANLVPPPTASATSEPASGGPGASGTARSLIPGGGAQQSPPAQPGQGAGPSASSGAGQNPFTSPSLPPSLLPIGSAGSTLAPTPPAGLVTQTGEPPFLTSSALVDMLRAVIAASAVRNAPPPGAAPPAAAAPSTPGTTPITGLPSLPPVVAGAVAPAVAPPGQTAPAPGTSGAPAGTSAFTGPNLATPAPATPRPVPNHIIVPSAPITASGSSQPAGVGAGTIAPNRIGGPAPTPAH
jgi:hypothetical protein